MKKFTKVITLLLVAMLSVLALVACGSDDSDKEDSKGTSASLVAGKTFAFDSYTVDGEDATELITAMYKEQTLAFKDGGSCTQTIVWADDLAEVIGTDPVVVEGTYKESGSTVTVTFTMEGEEDTVMTFTVDADTLTIEEDGSVMVYKVK